jgi:class 3 adenylate cyclase/predicted ATPase
MAARPTGLVTFLFTDIAGSSRLWQLHPDVMAAAVERHDAVVHNRVAETDGYVFGTAGDSFSIAFSSVADGLSCAVGIQEDLRADHWTVPMRLDVRMGLHAGESVERAGNYFGPTLNTIGRLHAVAHGGQVIASDAVVALAGEPPSPSSWRALGLHRLKDVPQPMSIHQLCHPGLPVEFPALRTAVVGNLPTEDAVVFGRDDVIERIGRMLMSDRVISIVGPGGAGKTTVASAAARRANTPHSGGSWWLNVAALRSPEDFTRALLDVVSPGRYDGGLDDLVEVLVARPPLIVLDEAEAARDVVTPVLRAVLDAEFRGSFLLTSRRTIGLPGEVVVPLGGLDPADASDFFRMCAARSGTVSTSNAEIETLCRRVGGLPLALQVAAAQTSTISSTLVAGEAVTVATELERMVDRTLDVLARDTTTIVERCAVWSGWFDSVDARAVARDLAIDVDAALADAARHALLVVERDEHRIRYRTLEPIRDVAVTRLERDGLLHSTVRAATSRMNDRLAALGEMFDDDRDVLAGIQLDERIDDLRSAHGEAVERGDAPSALACLGPLIMPFYARAMYWLGPLCEAALDLPEATESPHYGTATAMAAWAARSQGDLERARGLLKTGYETAPVGSLPSVTWLVGGWVCVSDRDVAGADHCFDEAVRLAGGEPAAFLANALAQNALRSTYLGRDSSALGRASAAVAESTGNHIMRAFCQFARAESVWRLDQQEAMEAYLESIDLSSRLGFTHTRTIATIGASALQARQGDLAGAAAALVESVRVAEEIGARTIQLPILENVAELLARAGDDEGALTIWHGLRAQDGAGSTPEQVVALEDATSRVGGRGVGLREAAGYLDLRSLHAFATTRLRRLT